MQLTIDSTSETVAQTTKNVERFSERLICLLSCVPDDKLIWTPSPTAKSFPRIVAHCALTNTGFADIITGNMIEGDKTEGMPSPEKFFQDLDEAEEKITTRESAIALLRENTAQLCQALDTVNADNIDTTPDSPFGPLPMRFWLDQAGQHMVVHSGQLTYLQTIWGDLDNHVG